VQKLNIDFNKYVDLSSASTSIKANLIEWLNPLKEIINFDTIKEVGKDIKWTLEDIKDGAVWIYDSIKK
jgi:hypothetical protein